MNPLPKFHHRDTMFPGWGTSKADLRRCMPVKFTFDCNPLDFNVVELNTRWCSKMLFACPENHRVALSVRLSQYTQWLDTQIAPTLAKFKGMDNRQSNRDRMTEAILQLDRDAAARGEVTTLKALQHFLGLRNYGPTLMTITTRVLQ